MIHGDDPYRSRGMDWKQIISQMQDRLNVLEKENRKLRSKTDNQRHELRKRREERRKHVQEWLEEWVFFVFILPAFCLGLLFLAVWHAQNWSAAFHESKIACEPGIIKGFNECNNPNTADCSSLQYRIYGDTRVICTNANITNPTEERKEWVVDRK